MRPLAAPLTGFGREQPRLLLAASTGGHLTQLHALARAAGVSEHATWVTFDSPQSRDLLRDQRVVWVDYIAPRDLRGTLRARRQLARDLAGARFDGVVSTGAALAVAAFLWGRAQQLPRRYVESVSRTDGPSLTGRIVRALRLADTFSQHASWASPAWPQASSVLRGYARRPRRDAPGSDRPLRILVTLGTIRPYRFDRLVDRVLAITGPDDEITWQLGVTERAGLPGDAAALIPQGELLDAARAADVVITHSGVGTILQLLGEGISPVVVPRRRQHREHIDDHQLQIWQLLADSRVAHPVEVEDLSRASLLAAARHDTVLTGAAP